LRQRYYINSWVPRLNPQLDQQQVDLISDESKRRYEAIVKTLYQLGELMLEERSSQFEATFAMIESVEQIDYGAIEGTARELFNEQINWVHICTFLLFWAQLAYTHGALSGRFDFIDEIHAHVSDYI